LEEYEVHSRGAEEGEEDEGIPTGGGDELEIVDGIAWIQLGKSMCSLMTNIRRIWSYPHFEPHPCKFVDKKN
jgi:hypothetical protein